MNVIKLKDVIMPDHMPHAEYFNKYLKGKYAYWVQMRYIVSFEHMRHEGYIACEEDITKLLQREDGTYPKPYGAPALDVYDDKIIRFVDDIETDKINSIIDLRLKNKYTADEDITTNSLRKFRAWLASELLSMDVNKFNEQAYIYFNEMETHVLKYYESNMYDETIKVLTNFNQSQDYTISSNSNSKCGCGSYSLNDLYISTDSCDIIYTYRKNIYNEMVKMFSNIDFWTRWSPDFIALFKKYIDNIIKLNLPFTDDTPINSFNDCNCATNNKHSECMDILKRLSVSLEYIYNDDVIGHKNYISDALRDWSSTLYESMQW